MSGAVKGRGHAFQKLFEKYRDRESLLTTELALLKKHLPNTEANEAYYEALIKEVRLELSHCTKRRKWFDFHRQMIDQP